MNILLIQLRRIGDLTLTTPAIAAVREKFPQADISLAVSSGARELLPAIKRVDRTIVARGKIADAASFFGVALRRFDYCLDFTRNDRSAFVTLLSNATKRITADYPRRRGKIQSVSYNVLVPLDVGAMHTVDFHLGLLAPLGIREACARLQLELPSSAEEKAERMLSDAGVPRDFVVIHPGSARAEKFWEAERWTAVLDHAAQRGLVCILTAGKSILEREHIAAIRSHTRNRVIDLTGRVDLLTLAAIIKRARLLLTIDSAPMHLAAAMQTPQVALFGPTNPLHWHPRFAPAVVLQAGHAQPLSEFSPNEKRAAMNLISTQQMIDAMEALLATPRGATL
jgi:predicted lipopolysaccharide heptosyltransferase III